ncbi:MAG: hypothetical protein JWN45_2057 [Acidobacteriaceae bacterium]|nr:hypothetical protein [Acidobacteriaceae bacterium]
MKILVLAALGLFAVLSTLPKQQSVRLVGTPTTKGTQKLNLHDDFEYLENATREKIVPQELADWLEKDRGKSDRESGCNEGESSEEVEIFIIGTYRESRMYIIRKRHSCTCGVHGDCPLVLLLANESGIRLIGRAVGFTAAVREKAGEHWPYVFFIQFWKVEASISGFHLGNDSRVRYYCGGTDNIEKSNVVDVYPCSKKN